jgi:hypothetical protein
MTLTARTPPRESSHDRQDQAPQSAFMMVFAFVAVIAYLCALVYAMANASYSVWAGLLLVPVIVAITVPLCTMAARHQHDPRVARLLMAALVLKMVGALVR